MPFIETVAEDSAADDVAAIYEESRAQSGYVQNLARAFSLRPEAFRAWQQLNGAVKAHDGRRYELATLAAARRLRSSYCTLAHGKALADRFFPAEEVARLPEGLGEADRAVMELAEKVVDDATAVAQEDIDRLRRLGLADAEIVDVVLAAAARCFFSKTLDALGVAPDAAYAELPPELRDSLTVGRPIDVPASQPLARAGATSGPRRGDGPAALGSVDLCSRAVFKPESALVDVPVESEADRGGDHARRRPCRLTIHVHRRGPVRAIPCSPRRQRTCCSVRTMPGTPPDRVEPGLPRLPPHHRTCESASAGSRRAAWRSRFVRGALRLRRPGGAGARARFDQGQAGQRARGAKERRPGLNGSVGQPVTTQLYWNGPSSVE